MKTLPILIIICLTFGSFVYHTAKHEEPRHDYHAGEAAINFIIRMSLYWWAGLFTVFTN